MASFNAGSIEATLDLDVTPFQQGLKYAREMGNAFARERFVAKADVDTTAATRALEKVQRRLDKFTGKHTARLDVTGYGTANAQLTRTARLAERLDRTFTPRIDMDGVPAAVSQIAAVDQALEALEGDRTTASVSVSGTPVQQVTRQADAIAKLTTNVDRLADASAAADKRRLDALGALRIAEARLVDLRAGDAAPARLVAGEEAVAKALRDVELQTSKVAAATNALAAARASVGSGGIGSGSAIKQIDSMSGRLKLYLQLAAAAGPALVPIGAVAVPALSGLVNLLGGAAIGAGALVVAFQGIGDASKALTEYALEPTAENLAKVQEAMAGLAPEARSFVVELQAMKPAFGALQDGVAGDFFGNFQGGLTELSGLLPEVQGILGDTAAAAGAAGREILTSLNSDRWAPFLGFIQREAPDAVNDFVNITGNLGKGLAEMWMAFDPLNNDFSSWLRGVSSDFADWASQLAGSNGMTEFIDYVRQSGPQVAGAFGAIGDAVLQIVQAAAPLGGPVLAAVEAVATGVAAIADSPLGTPFMAALTAVTLLNGALKVTATLSAAAAAVGVGGAAAGGAAAAGGIGAGTAALGAAGAGAAATKAPKLSAKAVGAIGLVAAAPMAVGWLEQLTGGYEGVQTSAESLADSLSVGKLPQEFTNIGDSVDLLANRNGLQKWDDDVSAALGMASGEFSEATDEIAALDVALGQIGTQQGPAAASAAFDQLTSSLGLSAEQAANLKAEMPTFEGIVGSLSFSDLAPGGGVFSDIASKIQNATSEAYQFNASLDAVNAALTGRSAARDFQASLDAATAALKENGKTLNINTEKGRANQAALDGIATSALNVASTMKGANRAEFLKGARADMVKAAMAFGLGEKAAQRLATKLGLVDRTKAQPDVDVDNKRAMAKIEAARAALLGLDRQKPTPRADLDTKPFTGAQRKALNDVGVLDRQKPTPRADLADGPFQNAIDGVMSRLGVADRANASPTVTANTGAALGAIQAVVNALSNVRDKSVTVTTYYNRKGTYQDPGNRADGGWINGPGGPRDDVIPMMLSNGEFVVNAAAAARHAGLLHAINSGRGMADGGRACGDPLTPPQAARVADARRTPDGRGLTPADVDRIIAAIEGKPPVVVVARSDEQAAELVERLDFELRRG